MGDLYPHQQAEVDTYGLHPHRGLLWCPRAGKSRAALHSALRMKAQGLIDRVVITSPNGVHDNWVIQELWPALGKELVWRWDTRRSDSDQHRALKDLPRDFSVLSIPAHLWAMDRARWLFSNIQRRAALTLLIVDESDDYASPSAKRSRRVRSMAKHCAATRILTGTPWHDSILHAWSQLEILRPGLSGHTTYGAFSRRYGQWETRFGPHGSWPALVGYQNVDELMDRVRKHCSILTADDIPGMARTRNKLINLDLSTESLAAVQSVLADIEVDTAAVKFGRIQQIVGSCPGRLDATAQLAGWGRFVVIWCRYREEIELLQTRLPDAITWYGGTPEPTRRQIRDTLRGDSSVSSSGMILLAQPQACARGLDFSRADLMVFHSHLPSVRMHTQALNRVTAIGSGTTPVYYLCNSGMDAYVIDRLRRKTKFSRITLQDIETLREYSLLPTDQRLRRLWAKPKGVDPRKM